MPDAGDPLALAVRAGLPAEFLYLRDELPRDRWTWLHEVAGHWLQMHAGFRSHAGHMTALTTAFRADPADPRGLHRALIPALQSFLQHLDGHHRIESGHYFPVFRTLEPMIAAVTAHLLGQGPNPATAEEGIGVMRWIEAYS